jgi:putative transposase
MVAPRARAFSDCSSAVAYRYYRTRDEAQVDLFNYIERFHNTRMRSGVARQDLKFSDFFKPSMEAG